MNDKRNYVSPTGATTKASFAFVLGALVLIVMTSATHAQQTRDPLTRFLDSLLGSGPVESSPAASPEPQTGPPPAPKPKAASKPATRNSQASPRTDEAVSAPAEQAALGPALEPPLPPRRPVEGAPVEDAASASRKLVPVAQPAPVSQPIPGSPAAALERVDAFFNSIDLMTANFTQNSATGQRTEGSLYIKHPGQLRFAYSPPSSLEIVSDGRSVAVRDKKLGTNDVYSVNQTPLKFLMQDNFNLARDTKVRDVQVRPDGIIVVSFEDSATLGGTSKVTLLFDAKANRLKEWTILDAQGYKTSVALSNVNVVKRASEAASQ